MEQRAMEQAVAIVQAQASVREMSEDEMTSMVASLAKSIESASKDASAEDSQEEKGQEPAVDPKKSVREKSVVCIECGKQFKVLTKKHLAKHGLTPAEYKAKWGLKKNQALISKYLARERRKKMESMQLWQRRKKSA